MNRPRPSAITPVLTSGTLLETRRGEETSAEKTLPDATADQTLSRIPEKPPAVIHRRQLTFVHPLQMRVLAIVVTYSLIIFVLLAIPVFGPLMQALDNPALSWQERAAVASDLLNLHARYWPWALGAGFVLLIHCFHSLRLVHHVAGPLYRLKQVFGHLHDGNLSTRATLRRGDYLIPEAELVNQMTAQLQAKISASKQAHATVAVEFTRLKQAVAAGGDPALTALAQQIERNLAELKTSLDWFKTHKG